ncbi:MAG: hypothetical protein KJP00_15740 [Bacteroidia bacterium]|nr:hypothetical protein [Bacteroidia bacterium]
MKTMKHIFLLLAILFVNLLPITTNAQSSNLSHIDSSFTSSEVRIGIRYTSDYYYAGRADSTRVPYLSPSIGYFHKSGLYIRGRLSYLTAANNGRVDRYIFSGGFNYFGKNFATGFSISEYIFNDLSYAIQAEMNTYVSVFAGYDFNAAIVYLDAGIGFSEGSDVFLSAEINKPIFAFANRLRISPAILINIGSLRYYNEYYTMRSQATGERKGKGRMPSTTISTISEIESYEKFQVLDYELDLALSYSMNDIRFYSSLTWTFPVNPSTIVSDKETYTEDLQNGFYWSMGIIWTL